MFAENLDPLSYARGPKLEARAAVALARALRTSAPSQPSPIVAAALHRVTSLGEEVNEVLEERRAGPEDGDALDPRVADQAIDAAWGAFHMRLAGLAALPQDRYPVAARAAALLAALFPEGLAFLKLQYEQEWTESEQLLSMIKREELGEELAELVGVAVLKECQRAHKEYGFALGVTAERKAADARSVREPLLLLSQAIMRYSQKVLALADEEDSDSIAEARRALAPLDRYREGRSRREARGGATEGGEETPAGADEPEGQEGSDLPDGQGGVAGPAASEPVSRTAGAPVNAAPASSGPGTSPRPV